jgi:hypothetical protein
MRFIIFTMCLLSLSTATSQAFQPTKIPELVMISPNSAKAIYEDKCSNGSNSDKANRDKFLKLMLANPKSKLAQLKVDLLKEIKQSGDEPRGEGFYIGEWTQTFHTRSGCASSANSYSAFVKTMTGGNSNYTTVKYLVTIDDDDNAGERTLKVHDIRPMNLRNN